MAGIAFIVRGTTRAIVRDFKRVQKLQAKTTVQALNTTAKRHVETPATREIASTHRVPRSRVTWQYNAAGQRTRRRRLSLLKANRDDHTAYLWFSRRTFIPAIALGRARQTRAGVSVGKHQFPGSFIARANGVNNQQVFKRRTAARYPLQVQGVPMLPRGAAILTSYVRASGPHFRREFERLMRVKLRRV